MQSGGGAQQGSGHGRSAAASPASSSSGVSAPQLGLDQQQQQQQQRQSLQQQFLRRSEGNDSILAYQSGAIHGVMGMGNFTAPSGSMQMSQQHRKFLELGQQQVPSIVREDGHNRSQGFEQQLLNPVHQAYIQAFQAAQQKTAPGMHSQPQMKMGMFSPPSKDQDMRMGAMKMQAANQSQASSSKKSTEQLTRGESHLDQAQQRMPDQRAESEPLNQPTLLGQALPVRPMQPPQPQHNFQNMTSNPIALASHMQAFAIEHNIDLSQPANANMVAQLIQSRMIAQQRANESNTYGQASTVNVQKQPVTSAMGLNENSPRGNSSSDASGQSGLAKPRHPSTSAPTSAPANSATIGNSNNVPMQQFSLHGRQNHLPSRQGIVIGNGMPPIPPSPQASLNLKQGMENASVAKGAQLGSESETLQMQHGRQPSRSSPQSTASPNDGALANPPTSQGEIVPPVQQQHLGFTKQQLHVLKAQILAFRRIKKGDATLPRELLQAIAPPPLEMQMQQMLHLSGTVNQDRSVSKNVEEHARHFESGEKASQVVTASDNRQKLEKEVADEGVTTSIVDVQSMAAAKKEPTPVVSIRKEEHQASGSSSKPEPEVEHTAQKVPSRSEISADRGKAVASQPTIPDTEQAKKSVQGNATQAKDAGSSRKYHGPLFDFPVFTRKHDAFGSSLMMNTNNNLTLAYDIKDLLAEEGVEFLKRKRQDSIRKIGDILAVNLERKRIRPDLVLRLQIEEKKLQLADVQARLRDEIEQQQQDIMAMPERPYRKFVRLCERQRQEMTRQVQASQKAIREKQLKSIFQWRKKLLETHWAIRDARTARNRGVAKYHERMLREFSKRKDDDRNKRMEALKNNDVERYREMLLEQQTSIPGDAAERYAVLSSFLSQTEEYLHRLGSKITAAKNQQEVEEAANAASAAAHAQGLSEEEVRSAAACAREEVMIRNRFSEMNAPRENSSVNKYYNLAHAVNERVFRQPSMLRAGTLRDYQLVGLQWMLSLYNNKLNGILADEMGLGKTVQVMSLIAYLMEFKGNYGPHLIIVPNAVLVNWKSELHNWLPSVSCIFYVGGKDQRSKLFSQEVSAMKFNVLVTTYEFIMYDRSKLSKVDWKYIVIDEAQRMKDRESVLARDLDRYRCQRRLLLTGTPLQNDLKELWSLLNLLLPEVFDNRKAFHDWFSQPFQKEPSHNAEDDWLETEKKVIVIHRLHQILEPFMLRRRVEDVEGSLPPKVSIVLRCRMSAIQSAIYDWIKSTGTLRIDPEDEKHRAQKNPVYQVKTYRTLNNRCMELRKACNHPLLNYPYFNNFSKDFLVRSCGKLWILDRILIKLQKTGHRVLLFSTMTKLLDILEEYLQWRRLVYRRIDGTTSLEDRESAIVDFNRPNTDCFIFLLSIRAAGRGLNLQTADTVIIYDPDPNPKNEEQAVARAHRIGQTREVKVIYMEAVVDKISSHEKEDEFRNGGTVDSDDDLAGKDRYMGSIESLIRNNIQQYKIDMADEVINAGRFDQRTTHEERRLTLETLLHDEERYQETVHDVPSLQEVNRMIARSEEEVELFDQMDEDLDWTEDVTKYNQVPKWLRANTKEVNATIANVSKKPSKSTLFGGGLETNEMASEGERKRGRPKGKKRPIYTELDDENGEFSEASSEERNGDSVREEEGEIGEFEDDEFSGAGGAPPSNKDQSEDDITLPTGGYGYSRALSSSKDVHMPEEAGSSGSSLDGQRLTHRVSPSVSSQKFGSLSALDARPSSHSKKLSDELEEGEIAVSGDSPTDVQQSGSWNQDRDEGEEEQVLQPRIKRKRSIRLRPRPVAERPDDKFNEKPSLRRGDSLLPSQVDQKYEPQFKNERGRKTLGEPMMLKQDQVDSSVKNRRNMNSRKLPNTPKMPGSLKTGRFAHSDESLQNSRENSDAKVVNAGGRSSGVSKMNEVVQKKCKNVISRLRKRIDREGPQIIPLLTDLWKRIESSGCIGGQEDNLFDLPEIGMRLDNYEYGGVMEFVSDVQLMLKGAVQFYGFSHEVRSEARKVHDLFFDILKIVFPDVDFREARNSLSFTSPPSASSYSKHVLTGQNKRQKPLSGAEPEPSRPQKPQIRGLIHEDTKPRGNVSQKESRLGSSTSWDTAQQDDSRPFTHPGELVICKKKRKDREKLGLRPGSGSAGPVSPTGISRGVRSPAGASIAKDVKLSQQVTQQQGRNNQSPQQVSGGNVGWANPVKRMRTDAGKRRPSHL